MRLGLIARADSRGLANQLYEIWRHLKPSKTLVIDPGLLSHAGGKILAQRPERYEGAPYRVSPWAGHELPIPDVEWLLDGIDVLFTAETPYWYEVYNMARDKGVRTICHVNPEFYRYARGEDIPRPDLLVAPTTWRLEHMPGVGHLPMPVARDRLDYKPREKASTFLHIAGNRTMRDRNSTDILIRALRRVREPCRVIIRSQAPVRTYRLPRQVQLDLIVDDLPDYPELYAEGDVLLAPRKFGGLSLPMQEAAACGMPVISTRTEPQTAWLPAEALIPSSAGGLVRSQGGHFRTAEISDRMLSGMIDRLVREPEMVQRLSQASDSWAESISWRRLLPLWRGVVLGETEGIA